MRRRKVFFFTSYYLNILRTQQSHLQPILFFLSSLILRCIYEVYVYCMLLREMRLFRVLARRGHQVLRSVILLNFEIANLAGFFSLVLLSV